MSNKSVLKKIFKVIGIILGAVLVLALAFAIGFKVYTTRSYMADNGLITEIMKSVGDSVQTYSDKDLVVFVPTKEEAKAIIVFYPGGKVQYTAYSGLMYELAERGFVCLLPRMPENLAFLRLNAADLIKEKYADRTKEAENLKWYMAGHSLGGVAASQYMADQEDGTYAGIILCASYTTTDFSDRDMKLLSIYGSEDKVLNMEDYEGSKSFWPADAQEYVIQGGNHAGFGNYGEQSGDGEATISNTQQITETANVIEKFITE
ncbi:MAG: lysophospholipase [Butyrivibrio sp.]|uniref:alpha/beta hydrolase n=1 Tax=Butyrivibrio sp. TaxID=28121 RepID=UPI0025B996A1|nr:alpha/beta hydrolase [Butyrivibrio sp.]MBQ6589042.1 lysophospholipase [Butyrivibrio sp.]